MNATKKKIISKSLPLVIIGLVIIIAVYAFFSDSFTWFTENKTVSGNGMKVEVVSPGCLVISKSTIQHKDTDNYGFEIDWSEVATSANPSATPVPSTVLEPCMRDSTASSASTVVPYLVTYTADQIDVTTGMAISGETPSTVATENTHYLKYESYIGVVGQTMTFDDLLVKFNSDDSSTKVHGAATVDIYLNNDYKGSMNFLNKDTASVSLGLTKLELNGETYKITYYCYFDGSLVDPNDSTKTLYRPETQDNTELNLSLVIEAVNPKDGQYSK